MHYFGLLFSCCLVYYYLQIVNGNTTLTYNTQLILLELHNRDRTANGITNMLTLDPYLENMSYNWAEHLYNTNTFVHSGNRYAGENIAFRIDDSLHTVDDFAVRLYQQWSDEIKYFHNYLFPNCSVPSTADTGHISQILWSQTSKLGCGIYGNFPKYILVCNYWPPGNIIGHRPF